MWALPPPPPPGTENPGARAAQEPVGTVLRSPLGGQPGGLALRQVRPPGAHRASPRRGPPPLAPGRPRRPGATFRPWKSAACWGNLDRCCSPRFPVDMQRAQQASRSGEEMSYVRKTKEINTGGVCLQSSCPSLAGGSSEGSSAPAGHWAASPWPAPASSPGLGLGRPERGAWLRTRGAGSFRAFPEAAPPWAVPSPTFSVWRTSTQPSGASRAPRLRPRQAPAVAPPLPPFTLETSPQRPSCCATWVWKPSRHCTCLPPREPSAGAPPQPCRIHRAKQRAWCRSILEARWGETEVEGRKESRRKKKGENMDFFRIFANP